MVVKRLSSNGSLLAAAGADGIDAENGEGGLVERCQFMSYLEVVRRIAYKRDGAALGGAALAPAGASEVAGRSELLGGWVMSVHA